MFRKPHFIAFLILVLCATMITSPIAKVSADSTTLKIGLLTDQSGALKQYGMEQERGFMLGLQYATNGTMEVAGRKIEVVKQDNGGKPDVAASQAKDLIEKEGAELLFGAPSSGVTLQLQKIALDSDVILMAGPAASPAITGANFNVNTFRVCRNTFQDFLAFAPYAKAQNLTKVVQFAADYDFGHSTADAAEAVLKPVGVEFVKPTIYAPQNTTDFTPYIQQILDSGAQAVIIIWAGDSTVRLFQQLDELGVRKKMTVIGAFNSNPIVKASSDKSYIGTVSWIIYHYTLPKNKINDWLVENHKKTYNGEFPDLFTECSFASAQAFVAALTATNGDASTKAMIPALEGLAFDGPKGHYTIRASDHQALVPMYIVKLVNLDDPEYKFYELLEEVPADKIIPPCLAPKERCAMDAQATAQPTQAK